MKKTIYILLIVLTTLVIAEEYQVEPFSAGEARAIQIYEDVLPLLEACEEHFEENEKIAFVEIEEIAKDEDIDLDEARESVLFDPEMAVFAIEQLEAYSANYYGLSQDAEKTAEALKQAARRAETHARVMTVLVEKWAPDALPEEGK